MSFVTVGLGLANKALAVHGVDEHGKLTLIRSSGNCEELIANQPFTSFRPRTLNCDKTSSHLTPYLLNKRTKFMTILVAYVPRPEGEAALEKGIEIAKSRNEHLVVVNASPGGSKEDSSLADAQDFEKMEQMLANTGLNVEVKQFVRGKNAV